ncbi:Predicted Zn-dependent peptidase [Ferrimonas sediminum]|uniref:Predicted Zn-dependent peptidase n=1 Tax=Ferrimonas sediminum TaxID=718193 RepID=A0A1G8XHW6_9GAMM|nr:pitrilysin family protein [Ferrimonas sediminum]SDJ89864.1 Predicted Zn-dependent peptidase [Ferrimonas sediminum]
MRALTLSLAAMMLAACSQTTPKTEVVAAPETNAPVFKAVETKAFTLPAYETITLKNGLTLQLMEKRNVPLITASATVRAGAVNDSVPGLATMTVDGLLLGTERRSKQQLEALIDSLGASLSTAAGKEGSSVSMRFMSKDADVMLPLLAELLRKPSFPEAEVDKAKARYAAQLAQQKESPRQVVGFYFDSLLYGEHPYANASVGESAAVSGMDNYDLKIFHGSWYQPQNMAITLVGDFDAVQMKQRLEGLFDDWRGANTPAKPQLAKQLPNPQAASVLLVDKPDAIETTFIIGGPGVSRDDPDYVALQVLNTILGGRFTSWLNDELRVNAGLTYGARSRFNTYSAGGSFQISTFTATKNTKAAVDLALKTYARLWQQGVDQATLDSAKAYVKGQFPPKYETSAQLAGLLGQMYLYGFGPEFINEFQNQVDSLTLARTQALIARAFPHDNLQLVMIGKADDIRSVAAEYGHVREVTIADDGFRF